MILENAEEKSLRSKEKSPYTLDFCSLSVDYA